MLQGPKHIDLNLTRAKFNELTHDLVQRNNRANEKSIKRCRIKHK